MHHSENNQPARGRSFSRVVGGTLRSGTSALAIGLALAASSLSVSAGTNGLTVNVTPLVPNVGTVAAPNYAVSYSGLPAALGQTLHSAYHVFVKNETNSTVNTAWLKLTSSINDVQPGLPFTSGNLPAGCQPSTDNLSLLCVLTESQLLAGVSFDLVMDNPNAASNSTPDSTLVLLSTIQAGQGNADANPSNVVLQRAPAITFSVNAPAGLRSYVLKGQGFRVNNGGSETKVTPPVSVPVDLKEEVSSHSCSPMYKKCLQSTLSIKKPDLSLYEFGTAEVPQLLRIDLLRDKSTLKPSADIYKAYLVLRYTPDSGGSSVPILECAPGPALPGSETRCVVPPNPALATDDSTGTFVDPAGHLHFRVLGKSNGLIDW
jgi:hypothetical protein